MGDVFAAWPHWAPFLTGWLLGWMLLARPRPLPPASGSARPPVAVVVPARDEAAALPSLLDPLHEQLRPGDTLVVVDDRSSDATAAVARAHGATVVAPPEPPAGWLGKPHACWLGADATWQPTLLFLDADVRPGPDLVDRVAAAVAEHPEALVSVQPWHRTGRAIEQLSLFGNLTALAGAGRFSVLGGRVWPRVAFGPVLALGRDLYQRVGGHARPSVRGEHTEDIALARAVGRAELYTGRGSVAFRMYPGGARDLVRGWTRSIATGALAAPRWAAAATVGWCWALAAAPFVGWWAYALAAVQCWVLGRRAGSFGIVAALLYPVPLFVFVGLVVRSLGRWALRRPVAWKGRDVPARRA